MSWQILIGISVVLYSLSVLLQRVLLKDDKSEPISFSIFFQTGVAFITALIILLVKGKIPIPNLSNIIWGLLAMTILYAGANIFIFKSLKVTEASRFTVIFSSKTLFAVLGISLFFKEVLSVDQWYGVIFVILGVIVVSIQKTFLKLNRGDIYAFIAAVLFGLANTNDRYLIKFFDPYSYVVIGFLLPAILIAVIYPSKIKLIKMYFQKNIIYKMILLFVLYGLSAATFFTALQITPNSSLAFSINATSGVLIVILSIIMLKEKDYMPRKIIGAILSLIGLILLNR